VGGINRHEEFHIARSTRNFFWQPNQTHNSATLSAGGLEQDGAPVKIQELFLAAAEPSHVDNLRGVYAHSLERGSMSDRGNYEL
jgi:hypothetical protein